MKDWLGNEYDVGDTVVYAAGSGRSITMILAEVVRIGEKSIGVKPLKSSRWKQHSGSNYYIDKRTGKKIDPFRDNEHIKDPRCWFDKVDGERVTSPRRDSLILSHARGHHQFDYVGIEFKDYVERVHKDTEVVNLTVTQNITKWTGPIGELGEG